MQGQASFNYIATCVLISQRCFSQSRELKTDHLCSQAEFTADKLHSPLQLHLHFLPCYLPVGRISSWEARLC